MDFNCNDEDLTNDDYVHKRGQFIKQATNTGFMSLSDFTISRIDNINSN